MGLKRLLPVSPGFEGLSNPFLEHGGTAPSVSPTAWEPPMPDPSICPEGCAFYRSNAYAVEYSVPGKASQFVLERISI